MAIRTVVNTVHRMFYPFLPIFARGLGVDVNLFSLALTARSASGMLNPFLGWVGDIYGRRTGMLLGIGLFTLGIGFLALFPSFPMFVFMLISVTLGKYLIGPSMHAYLGDMVPYERRGLVVGLLEMGWSLSFIVGVPIIGVLIAKGGWYTPFPYLGGLGILSFFLLIIIFPQKKRNTIKTSDSTLWQKFGLVLSYGPAIAGIIAGTSMSASNEMVNLIFGLWLEDVFGVQILALGSVSLVIGLSELLGESFVSGLTDKLGKKRSVGIGLYLNIIISLFLPFLGQTFVGAIIGLFFFYLTFEFSIVASVSIMTEIVPYARATVIALNIGAMSFGRAISALIAIPIYTQGIYLTLAVASVFNLIALIALKWVRTPQD